MLRTSACIPGSGERHKKACSGKSGTGWKWSKIISLGDNTAVAVHEGFGMHGRLLMFDRDGVLSWMQPLDYVRSLLSDGSALFAASCDTGMVIVSAYSVDGNQLWERHLETVPCGNESIDEIPMSLGLVGEIYLLHGHQAITLNRDGTMHSIVQGDFASQASSSIIIGSRGKALLQESSGDIYSISEMDGLKPYVTDYTADIANGALAWLADGSLLSVSHQSLPGSRGYKSMHQLVRISPDGKVMERLEQHGVWLERLQDAGIKPARLVPEDHGLTLAGLLRVRVDTEHLSLGIDRVHLGPARGS